MIGNETHGSAECADCGVGIEISLISLISIRIGLFGTKTDLAISFISITNQHKRIMSKICCDLSLSCR